MQVAEIAVLLEAAPVDHQKRCALAHNAIESGRWPQAVCGLRHAAAEARAWADRVCSLAAHYEAETTALQASAPPAPQDEQEDAFSIAFAVPLTAEALEAGLLVIANSISRECAIRARRAINGVMTAQGLRTATPVNESPRRAPIPTEAALIGAHLDAESIEQGEPA